ncbi:hypothetical protein PMIN04_011767 [Paraphaeosphaeria minitans]
MKKKIAEYEEKAKAQMNITPQPARPEIPTGSSSGAQTSAFPSGDLGTHGHSGYEQSAGVMNPSKDRDGDFRMADSDEPTKTEKDEPTKTEKDEPTKTGKDDLNIEWDISGATQRIEPYQHVPRLAYGHLSKNSRMRYYNRTGYSHETLSTTKLWQKGQGDREKFIALHNISVELENKFEAEHMKDQDG